MTFWFRKDGTDWIAVPLPVLQVPRRPLELSDFRERGSERIHRALGKGLPVEDLVQPC